METEIEELAYKEIQMHLHRVMTEEMPELHPSHEKRQIHVIIKHMPHMYQDKISSLSHEIM
jgi:hypothetical protein